jgi:uncharacterized protein YkwD
MPIRPPARHRSRRPGRIRPLWVLSLLPVLLVSGFYLTRGSTAGTAQTAYPQLATGGCASQRPAAQRAAPGSLPGTVASPCAAQPLTSSAGRPGGPGARRAATPAGPHRHRARRPGHRSPSPPPPPAHTAPPSPSPPATSPPGDQQGGAAAQVLALINQARAQAGLPPYTLSTGLGRSSATHNSMMASGCGLSHQCPGEPSLGARETGAGVHWTSAGENIGEGGPVAGTDSAIAQLAVTITQDMLNEKPPDDGHRLNILSSAFHHIGIAVLRNDSGTVWMTQDFSD